MSTAMSSLVEFAGMSAVIVVVPGPDQFLTLRYAVGGGRPAALSTVAGIMTGIAAWAGFTLAGFSAVVASSDGLYLALRIAGIVYLSYLALSGLRRAVRGVSTVDVDVAEQPVPWQHSSAFRAGLLTNLGNPKIGILYLSLLPQFVDNDKDVLAQSLVLCAVHVAESALWLVVVALATSWVLRRMQSARKAQVLDAVVGVALLAFVLRMILVDF
jgi:threonine/homoserine/homoserine lactone efflux protein